MTKIQFELSAKPSKAEKADGTFALRRWRKPAVGTDVSLDGFLSTGRVTRPDVRCTKQRLMVNLDLCLLALDG